MCAPIRVVVGKPRQRYRAEHQKLKVDKRTLNDLPPVWLANLGEATECCKVQPQQLVIQVPEPGSDVENSLPGGTEIFKAQCNGNPAAGAAKTLPDPIDPSVATPPTSTATNLNSFVLPTPSTSASVPVSLLSRWALP